MEPINLSTAYQTEGICAVADGVGFEPTVELTLVGLTVRTLRPSRDTRHCFVGKTGFEPVCDQLPFLQDISLRRYIPICLSGPGRIRTYTPSGLDLQSSEPTNCSTDPETVYRNTVNSLYTLQGSNLRPTRCKRVALSAELKVYAKLVFVTLNKICLVLQICV
jgi:hypothetical protein